jgi:hypothetical protein
LQIPLDPKVKELADLPYTISFIIRKRQQIDNLNELSKDKRPTEEIIWDGSSEELEEWLEKVLDPKKKEDQNVILKIKDNEIEG